MEFKQLVIKAAYLNVNHNDIIDVKKIPKGDKNYNKNKVWLLKKELYRLKNNLEVYGMKRKLII